MKYNYFIYFNFFIILNISGIPFISLANNNFKNSNNLNDKVKYKYNNFSQKINNTINNNNRIYKKRLGKENLKKKTEKAKKEINTSHKKEKFNQLYTQNSLNSMENQTKFNLFDKNTKNEQLAEENYIVFRDYFANLLAGHPEGQFIVKNDNCPVYKNIEAGSSIIEVLKKGNPVHGIEIIDKKWVKIARDKYVLAKDLYHYNLVTRGTEIYKKKSK